MKITSLFFMIAAFVGVLRAEESVTIKQLLDAPATYHGHRVIVRGVWDFGFETSLFFDEKNEGKAMWVEVEKQDVEKPKDKKLMLLQQLFHMRREADVTPAINVGLVEVEFEGYFYDWSSTPETKAELAKLKGDERLVGGFGHLGCCQQKIVVAQVRWFRSTLESSKPDPERRRAIPEGSVERSRHRTLEEPRKASPRG